MISRSCNIHDQVAVFAIAPNLAGEYFIRVIIVAHGGHELAIGRQRDGGEWTAIFFESAKELGGKMGGIGGAAAVAAHQQLVAAGQAAQDHF